MTSIALIAFIIVVMLFSMNFLKLSSVTWLTPFVLYGCVLICTVHSLLAGLRKTAIYIFPTYFVLILIAPIVSCKFMFPYSISPRRFYASLFKLDSDPWHPPSGPQTFILTQLALIFYVFCVSYFVLKLIVLKRCGTYKSQVLSKYAIKMTTFAYIIYLSFRYTPILGATVDLLFSWLPFAGDMIMGVPMAILCFLMLLFRYEEAVVTETNGMSLNRLTFWQNII